MKILEVKTLAIPDIKVIRFGRFNDHRGYFTETFRKSDFQKLDFMKGVDFLQCNDAFSKAGTFRGLHFQWNPFMGKLVRVEMGKIIDFALDIRKGSPDTGKIIAYELTGRPEADNNEWIWLPPGFAHGILAVEESHVEYFCSGEYSPGCEAAISPLAKDMAVNMYSALWSLLVCMGVTVLVSVFTKPKSDEELKDLVYGLTRIPNEGPCPWYKHPKFWAAVILVVLIGVNIVFW